MSDFLLELSGNPTARKLIKTLGLPLPMPQRLRRAKGPWTERPMQDETVYVGTTDGGELAGVIAETLTRGGANAFVEAGDSYLAAFKVPGEAWGRPATKIDASGADGQARDDNARIDGLVFDATGITEPGGLRALYAFFHPLVGRLTTCARLVVLGRPAEAMSTASAAAAQSALHGFVRSTAKELGKRGTTAQLLVVDRGAEARVAGPLRFFLSDHSSFVTGQPVRVGAHVATKAIDGYVRSLEGKVALVTGAARGIGEATVKLLAGEGAHVVCLDRPGDDALCSRVAREVGGSVLLVDVSSPDAPGEITRALMGTHGGVDIVVHNAGITRDKTLAKMKPEAWDQAIGINLTAIVRIDTALVQGGALRDDGRVIVLCSVAGLAGNVGQTNYAASKAGLVGYVRTQSKLLAPRGITVNGIAPGFIETRLTAAIPLAIREVGRRLSSLGQGGQPQDVAEAITFLATPAASGLSGVILRVCGGAFIGA